MEIVRKIEIKSAKVVKSLEIFLSKLLYKFFISELFFFCFRQILVNLTRTFAAHHEKSSVRASVLHYKAGPATSTFSQAIY